MKLTAEQIKEYRAYMPPIEGRHDTDDCRALILKYNYRLNRALDALEVETDRANANRDEAILIDQNSADKDRYFDAYIARIPSIVRRVLESHLSDAQECTRCWSAWEAGTMTADDFANVDIDEIMDAVIEGIGRGGESG